MGGRDHHRRESVGPRDIDCTFLYEIRKKFDVRKRLLWSRIAEKRHRSESSWKSAIVRDLCFSLCKRLLSCSTPVCEVTTPSLHSHILRSARGLLLRLNAIAMNPLPFWLKILETFLFPPSLTPMFRFHEFPLLSFYDEPTGNRSVLGTSTVHFCTKYERSSMSERDSYGVASQKNATEVKAVRKARSSGIYASLCVSDCCQYLSWGYTYLYIYIYIFVAVF